ncbi:MULTISPECIES: hypothetical protein [Acinetobacter]|uniref:hypothetical protein n=1 Tax=Acinetobacter TaxID=469 RepID=UPI0002AED31F|nr:MULTISPECIES: hypothetical protein [Acinetobacter]ELW77060.1 hypothetical protein ACINWC743_A0637 [Acinetobacter sp. WC-743]MBJ8428122.1 hypothetical protein [Acinetobacter bereziniae]MBJ8445888.1 hypothetical protein [Acinetobacter bereziniae]
MTTKVDISNQALSMIGADSITSFEENTSTARRMKTLYDTSRKAVLRLHPFHCATKRIKLSPLSTCPEFGYAYQFQLPDDLVTVINANTEDYVIENDKILSNNNQLQLVYVFDLKNEERFDTLFTECLILYLASKISKAITGNQGNADSLYMQCQELLKQAKAIQAQEVPSPQFFKDSDYAIIRGRYNG